LGNRLAVTGDDFFPALDSADQFRDAFFGKRVSLG
jgi:hypothetical protein